MNQPYDESTLGLRGDRTQNLSSI